MHILIGATGSVACIKLPDLVRELKTLKDVSCALCAFIIGCIRIYRILQKCYAMCLRVLSEPHTGGCSL